MAIVGERTEQYVLDQIKARQKWFAKPVRNAEGRALDDKYNAARTAWLKLASGVKLTDGSKFGGGLEFPKKYVLFNGTAASQGNKLTLRSGIGFEKSYDTSDKEYGIVPMPGIISADVKCLGRGSLKEANVKIKCWSKRQFEILEELYLRLGYNMMMEWGWSKYLDNSDGVLQQSSTIIDGDWFSRSGDNTDYRYWLNAIEKNRRVRKGNYDGFFGKVTNFTWTFLNDGSYDIDLKMITHGDVIESLTIPPSSIKQSGNLILPVTNAQETNPIVNAALRAAVATIGSDNLNPASIKEGIFGKDTVINQVITNPGNIKTGAEEGDNQYISLKNCTDKLNTHLFNLKFLGRGINNYFTISYPPGDDNPADDYGTFAINPEDINYKNGFEPNYISILAKTGPGGEVDDNDKKVNEAVWGVCFGGINWKKEITEFAKSDKQYSESKQGGAIVSPKGTGGVGQDWISLFKNDPDNLIPKEEEKEGEQAKPKPTINLEGYTYVRFQYLLWFLNKYCIYENTKTTSKAINLSWASQIPTYVVPPVTCGDSESLITVSGDPENILLHNPNVTFNTERFSEFGRVNLYSGIAECIGKVNGVWYLDAQNLYIGTGLIERTLNSSMTGRKLNMFSFLKTICDNMNGALGGINHLTPIIDTETNTLIIQDNLNFPNRKKLFRGLGLAMRDLENGQELQLYGYRRSNGVPVTNFIRNIDLKTTISKEMASMITVGATAGGTVKGMDSTGFSKFNKGKINRFNPEYSYVPESTESSTTGTSSDSDGSAETKLHEAKKQDMAGLFGYDFTTIQFQSLENIVTSNRMFYEFKMENTSFIPFYNYYTLYREINLQNESIDSQVEQIQTSIGKDKKTIANCQFVEGCGPKNMKLFNEYFIEAESNRFKDSEGGGPSIGFLPFGLNLKMDGLGGYKIYNKLDVDTHFLPYNYPKVTEFVISKVNHTIQGGDWETSIETINVPKSSETSQIFSSGVPPIRPGRNPITETEEGEEVPVTVSTGESVPCNKSTGERYKYQVRRVHLIKDEDVNKFEKFTESIVYYIEGGYYNPFHSYSESGKFLEKYAVMYRSGETLWGQDRAAGKLEAKGGDAEAFWTLVDKYSGWAGKWNKIWTGVNWKARFGKPGYFRTCVVKTRATGRKQKTYMLSKNPGHYPNYGGKFNTATAPKYKNGWLFDNTTSKGKKVFKWKKDPKLWKHYENPLEKGSNVPRADQELMVKYATTAMKDNYDKFTKNYMGKEFRDFVNSNGRLQFMYYRAVYNGSKYFKQFARNLEKNYFNKGVRNIDELICADIHYRYINNKKWHEHGKMKVLTGLGTPTQGLVD